MKSYLLAFLNSSTFQLARNVSHKSVFSSYNFFVKMNLHNSETFSRKCWNCNENICKCTFFCKCGKVQTPSKQCTYFEMFGISENDFDLDLNFINKKWKKFQQELHPDKYSNLSEFEKQISVDSSSLVNEAYNTLKYPLSRAIYILKLKGYDLNEKDISVDSNFLMEVLEFNEKINEIQSNQDRENLAEEINKKYNHILQLLSQHIMSSNYEEAFKQLKNLTYFNNIRNKI